MENVLSLKCLVCGQHYRPAEVDYVCPDHNDEGILDVQYDYERARRSFRRAHLARDLRRDIWRYEALLPCPPP